jgi:hypothetical protein
LTSLRARTTRSLPVIRCLPRRTISSPSFWKHGGESLTPPFAGWR